MSAHLLWVGLWLLLLGAGACDPETEGCLDYRALEIDVTADLACDACCEFPALSLQLLPRRFIGDSTAPLGLSADLIADSDTLRSAEVAFFLRDVQLELADGTRRLLTDTLTVVGIVPGEGSQVVEPSLLLAEPRSTARYDIGTLLEPLDVVAVVIGGIGPPQELAGVNPVDQPATSPLAGGRDGLLVGDDGELLVGAVSAIDSAEQDPQLLAAVGRTDSEIRWTFAQPVVLERGFDLAVTLALPLDTLAQFRPELLGGEEIPGDAFANDLLRGARVIEAAARR